MNGFMMKLGKGHLRKEKTQEIMIESPKKQYSKIDHIVGIHTLDKVIKDLNSLSDLRALDLYLSLVEPKYSVYSGYLDKILKGYSSEYFSLYNHKDKCVLCNGVPIPQIEVALRKRLIQELRGMMKYIRDNHTLITQYKHNKDKKDLVGVCKERVTEHMLDFSMFHQIKDYEDIARYVGEEREVELKSSKFMGDRTEELQVLKEFKGKYKHKAIIALVYKATEEHHPLVRDKQLLKYYDYSMSLVDNSKETYEIVEALLKEKLESRVVERLERDRTQLREKLIEKQVEYRDCENTKLTNFLINRLLKSISI